MKSNQQNSQAKKTNNDKSSRKMFLFKKQTSSSSSSSSSSTSAASAKENSKSSNVPSTTTGNEMGNGSRKPRKQLSTCSKAKWHAPTIIRPVANRDNRARKKVPPRPPPPKINKQNGCVSVIPLDPPSYEEVLRADTRGRGKLPIPRARSTKGPAPPTPLLQFNSGMQDGLLGPCIRASENVYASIDSSFPLIDFSSPEQPNQRSTKRRGSTLGDLEELEEIFSKAGSNEPAFVDPKDISSSHSHLLMDDDIYKSGREIGLFRHGQNEDNQLFSIHSVDNVIQRPIPTPRTSITSQNAMTNRVNVLSRDPSDIGPSLPPRPPPGLQDIWDDFSVNRDNSTESPPPPLPPRPKNYYRTEPHGIALYDYSASQADDLSFKASNTITLIHRINDEWLYGCLGEREGMFPRSFVQIIVPLPDDPEFQAEGESAITGPRCLALFDFVSDRDDELSFKVGDMIRLVARISDHWIKGVLKDRIGLVPSNFVRIVEDLHQDSDTLTEACVQYDFQAESPMELSCKSGDVIKIIYPIDSDWILAEHNGKEGIVPWTYLDFGH